MRTRLTALLLVLLMVSGVAFSEAETVKVEEISAAMGESKVCYPQLSGLSDPSVQKKINDDVVQSGDIPSLLVKLTTGGSVQADYQCFWNEWVFSALLTVEEKQAGSRREQSETALTYDLSDGEKLTLDRLFSDSAEAVRQMEAMAETSLGREMTEYMDNRDVTPLPKDSFTTSGGSPSITRSASFPLPAVRRGRCSSFMTSWTACGLRMRTAYRQKWGCGLLK